jgi:hypothetical protein
LGPSSLTDWKESYDVLYTAMLMIDAVRRPQLEAYRAKISLLSAQYGEKCWALLYQADVRCRSEFMQRLKLKLESQHNADVIAGRLSTFDTQRPWNSVWDAAISGIPAADFWDAEFKVSALLIASQSSRPTAYLEGDADIAGSASAAPSHPVTRGQQPHAPKNPTGKASPAPKPQPGVVKKTQTNDNPPLHICKNFNHGTCTGNAYQCPRGDRVHVCWFCLGRHPGTACTATGTANKNVRWQPDDGGGKAKAKAKGKNTRKRGWGKA